MKRERMLQRRLHTLQTLDEAVTAMRSLSAHHFRLSRQALPEARGYRDEMEKAVAESGLQQQVDLAAPAGVLLVVSDLGLCGDYNTRLVSHAVNEYRQLEVGKLYCVGRRPRALLTRHGIAPQHYYHSSASVAGLPELLLQLAEDMLDDFLDQTIGCLFVISARFEGAGQFAPIVTQLLPARHSQPLAPLRPTNYQAQTYLWAVAAREYLYASLYELLVDALASEHGMRLLAAESARGWLDETMQAVRRQLSACRREAMTQEVLDIVAGAWSGRKPARS